MRRALIAGTSFGALFAALFAVSFFDGSELFLNSGPFLVVAFFLGSLTIRAWAPTPTPFRTGLVYAGAAAATMVAGWLAMAGAGFVTLSEVWWRSLVAGAALLLFFLTLVVLLATLGALPSWFAAWRSRRRVGDAG